MITKVFRGSNTGAPNGCLKCLINVILLAKELP